MIFTPKIKLASWVDMSTGHSGGRQSRSSPLTEGLHSGLAFPSGAQDIEACLRPALIMIHHRKDVPPRIAIMGHRIITPDGTEGRCSRNLKLRFFIAPLTMERTFRFMGQPRVPQPSLDILGGTSITKLTLHLWRRRDRGLRGSNWTFGPRWIRSMLFILMPFDG
jgi:hypothetical protein